MVTGADAAKGRWKKRILLVHHDERVQASLALVLESKGYDVVLATDGYEVAAKCKRHQPDLLLMDLMIPLKKDGWVALELIEQLRPLLPMIVITAGPMGFERAVAFGVDAAVENPLDFSVLLPAIEQLLSEPPGERLARLTNQNFKTIKLDSVGGKK